MYVEIYSKIFFAAVITIIDVYPRNMLIQKLIIVGQVLPILWCVSKISNGSSWDTIVRMDAY